MARRPRKYFKSRDNYHGKAHAKAGTIVSMGKMFRTRAGRYGCYVYINGRRSHFEEKSERRLKRSQFATKSGWNNYNRAYPKRK